MIQNIKHRSTGRQTDSQTDRQNTHTWIIQSKRAHMEQRNNGTASHDPWYMNDTWIWCIISYIYTLAVIADIFISPQFPHFSNLLLWWLMMWSAQRRECEDEKWGKNIPFYQCLIDCCSKLLSQRFKTKQNDNKLKIMFCLQIFIFIIYYCQLIDCIFIFNLFAFSFSNKTKTNQNIIYSDKKKTQKKNSPSIKRF